MTDPAMRERDAVQTFLTKRANNLRDGLPYDSTGQIWAIMGELRDLVKQIERGEHLKDTP